MPDIPSKISEKSVHNFLSYLVHTDRQTDKQTKTGKNITSLAEVANQRSCKVAYHGIRDVTLHFCDAAYGPNVKRRVVQSDVTEPSLN